VSRWTPEQTAELLTEYRAHGAAFVAARVGKSEIAVRVKACRTNQKFNVRHETPRGKRILTPGKESHG
jgi:hypothetical protein